MQFYESFMGIETLDTSAFLMTWQSNKEERENNVSSPRHGSGLTT